MSDETIPKSAGKLQWTYWWGGLWESKRNEGEAGYSVRYFPKEEGVNKFLAEGRFFDMQPSWHASYDDAVQACEAHNATLGKPPAFVGVANPGQSVPAGTPIYSADANLVESLRTELKERKRLVGLIVDAVRKMAGLHLELFGGKDRLGPDSTSISKNSQEIRDTLQRIEKMLTEMRLP